MRPRREVFAADYIRQTVDAYKSLLAEETAGGAAASPEICWAGDVLASYFAVAGGHPAIEEARAHVLERSTPVLEEMPGWTTPTEGATTLEWTLSSPPPFHSFEELPRIK